MGCGSNVQLVKTVVRVDCKPLKHPIARVAARDIRVGPPTIAFS